MNQIYGFKKTHEKKKKKHFDDVLSLMISTAQYARIKMHKMYLHNVTIIQNEKTKNEEK